MTSLSLKWGPYEASFYMSVYSHHPFFLQKIWETEGHLHSHSDPIHSCLQWKSRLYFTPQPNLPRLKVSHFLVTKGGFTRDRKGLEFLSGFRGIHSHDQVGKNNRQATPSPLPPDNTHTHVTPTSPQTRTPKRSIYHT